MRLTNHQALASYFQASTLVDSGNRRRTQMVTSRHLLCHEQKPVTAAATMTASSGECSIGSSVGRNISCGTTNEDDYWTKSLLGAVGYWTQHSPRAIGYLIRSLLGTIGYWAHLDCQDRRSHFTLINSFKSENLKKDTNDCALLIHSLIAHCLGPMPKH